MSRAGGPAAGQWPKFAVKKPDPEQGEVYSGKAGLGPELTLVEFVSTSAAFHGVTSQPLATLEAELLKVFPHNVMPANAAAWYMAKRKYYLSEPQDQQLLPFLLKKFPDKFRILGKKVIFLEVYEQEAARAKLQYLVLSGLHAYFAHKADEYGVYFFDPRYYEGTEPFHAALRLACPNQVRSSLVQSYFDSEGMKEQFQLRKHSTFHLSISRMSSKVKVVTNTTGVIVSMINSQYGFIKFGAAEKALFCAKSLFKDGWQFSGDPLKLPAMKFDGYQIQGGAHRGPHGGEKHSWYAVMVWCGRRPSPQYCSTAEDLNSTPVFRDGRGSAGEQGVVKKRQPSSSMCVGIVEEVRRDGAVIKSTDEAAPGKVWVPGWRRKLANCQGTWLSAVEGECIGLGDLVAYYAVQTTTHGFATVAKSVVVLKENQDKAAGRRGARARRITEGSEGRGAGEDTDSEDELTVSEGELEWLEKDLGAVIAVEDPKAKTMDLLRAVQINLQDVRGRRGRRRTSRKPDRAGYRPLPRLEGDFRRMKRALAELDPQEYNSHSDADYEPGDEVEEVETTEDEGETTELADSSFGVSEQGRRGRRRTVTETSVASTAASGRSGGGERRAGRLPHWVRACSMPEVFDPAAGKFVPVDRNYREENDPDYELPESDRVWESDVEEEEAEEEDIVTILVREAEEPLPDIQELEEGNSTPIVSPVKVTLTPAKEETEEGDVEVELEEDEVTLVDSAEAKAAGRKRNPSLWVQELLLTEQVEEEEEDGEYLPPPTCLDIDLDYDEYGHGDDEIPAEEVAGLAEDAATLLTPPAEYVAVWVKVPSVKERIAAAQEQHAAVQAEADARRARQAQEDASKAAEENVKAESDAATTSTGGESAARRKSVGRSGSEGEEGKPRRERKKSSSSIKKVEEVKEEEVKKQSPIEVIGAQGKSTVGAATDAQEAVVAAGDA